MVKKQQNKQELDTQGNNLNSDVEQWLKLDPETQNLELSNTNKVKQEIGDHPKQRLWVISEACDLISEACAGDDGQCSSTHIWSYQGF